MTLADPPRPLRASRSWFAVLALTALGHACGGKSAAPKPAETSGTGGVAGSSGTGALAGSSTGGTEPGHGGTSGTAGAGATGGSGGSGGSGAQQAAGTSGGTTPQGGATLIPPGAGGSEGGSGGDAGETCDVDALWKAITSQTGGVTTCSEASPMLGPDEHLGALRGAVVIDAEGRVVDITGRTGAKRQAFLDGLADQRWPCLAGKTIGYQCLPPN